MAILIIGGEEINAPELAYLRNKEWSAAVQPYVDIITGMERKLAGGTDLAQVYQGEWMQTLSSVDDLLEIVLERIPDEEEREFARHHITQTEIINAFMELVKEANSTGFFLGMASVLLPNGAKGQATGTNLPVPNGEFGQTS